MRRVHKSTSASRPSRLCACFANAGGARTQAAVGVGLLHARRARRCRVLAARARRGRPAGARVARGRARRALRRGASVRLRRSILSAARFPSVVLLLGLGGASGSRGLCRPRPRPRCASANQTAA